MSDQHKDAELVGGTFLHDAWIVQLDSLIRHAKHFRTENVMKYKGKQKGAFDAGLTMIILLMEAMIEDLQKESKEKLNGEQK
tara:strand:+ start:1018 stop:1263 length:246 start_codon:yes stop_codon:yes gene_type:complete